jgi:hypothetical protein
LASKTYKNGVDLPVSRVLGNSLALLQSSRQFGLLSLGDIEIIVGQFAQCCWAFPLTWISHTNLWHLGRESEKVLCRQ